MNEKGILIVISGFSGAGKGTLVKGLMRRYNNYALSISATTRRPRLGEVDEREYFFKTKEEFLKMIDEDKLIEYAEYVGNFYGTPKEYVDRQLNSGKDVILEIEIQGALNVKEKFPDTLLLFITPPSAQTLRCRLIGRGTEDLMTIESRLKRASEEAEGIEKYDYFVINDDLDECIVRTHSIIQGEHSRASRNISNIELIREELKGF
ncbi:MAG: guanylate kinase [Lachnotalea sp.]